MTPMRHTQLVEYVWLSLENLPKDSVIEMNKMNKDDLP